MEILCKIITCALVLMILVPICIIYLFMINIGSQAEEEWAGCFRPLSVPQGIWYCKEMNNTKEMNKTELNFTEEWHGSLNLTCILECDPGNTYSQRSFTSCTGGKWSTAPEQMNCSELAGCFEPLPVHHGMWFCTESNNNKEMNVNNFKAWNGSSNLTCILECDPGYTYSTRSFTSCSGGKWITSPSQMICSEAAALITGGDPKKQSVEIYTSEGLSKILPNLPDRRKYHTVERVDGVTLLCGGSWNNKNTLRTCLKLNLDDMTFYSHSTLIKDRKFHSSISSSQQLILIGGSDTQLTTSSSKSTEYLLPKTNRDWNLGFPLLEGTEFACTVKTSRKFFIAIGGFHKNKYLDHIIEYNLEDGSSSRLANLPSGRGGHGCVLVKNETFNGILIAGGRSYGSDLPLISTLMFNLGTFKWKEVGRLNVGRYDLEMVVLGDKILAMGGKDKDHKSISSVEQFNMTTRSWMQIEDLQEKRANFALTTIPDCPIRLPVLPHPGTCTYPSGFQYYTKN